MFIYTHQGRAQYVYDVSGVGKCAHEHNMFYAAVRALLFCQSGYTTHTSTRTHKPREDAERRMHGHILDAHTLNGAQQRYLSQTDTRRYITPKIIRCSRARVYSSLYHQCIPYTIPNIVFSNKRDMKW